MSPSPDGRRTRVVHQVRHHAPHHDREQRQPPDRRSVERPADRRGWPQDDPQHHQHPDHRQQRERVVRDQVEAHAEPVDERAPESGDPSRVLRERRDVGGCGREVAVRGDHQDRSGGGGGGGRHRGSPPHELAAQPPPDAGGREQRDRGAEVRPGPRGAGEQPGRGDHDRARGPRKPLGDVERAAQEQADERVRQAEEASTVQLRATEQRRERGRPAQRALDDQRAEQDDARRCDRTERSPASSGRRQRERGERRRRDDERDHRGVGQRGEMPDQQQRQRHERHGDRERRAEASMSG